MKKEAFILGCTLALVISLVVCLPGILRAEDWPDIIHAFLHSAFYIFICWCYYHWLLNSKWWNQSGSLMPKVWVSMASIAVLTLFVLAYEAVFNLINPGNEFLPSAGDNRTPLLLVRGFAFNVIIYFIVFFIRILQKQQAKALEVEKLKQEQLQAQLSTLKEQLSPHFMFNALNTLSLMTNESVVKEYIDKFADTYRYSLKHQQKDTTLLSAELDFVNSYLYIIKTRLENAIKIDVSIDKTILNSQIPPLTLQLLAENAIKHNIASVHEPLELSIYNTNDELVVENSYRPKISVGHSGGMGLENIKNRYWLLFRKEITIEITQSKFIVKLPIVS